MDALFLTALSEVHLGGRITEFAANYRSNRTFVQTQSSHKLKCTRQLKWRRTRVLLKVVFVTRERLDEHQPINHLQMSHLLQVNERRRILPGVVFRVIQAIKPNNSCGSAKRYDAQA